MELIIGINNSKKWILKIIAGQTQPVVADLPDTLSDSVLILDQKTETIYRKNDHEDPSAISPNDTACMFNIYFAYASNNSTG